MPRDGQGGVSRPRLASLELARYGMLCYVKVKRKEKKKVRRQSKAPETPRFFRSRDPQKM